MENEKELIRLRTKAQIGFTLLQDAILELLSNEPEGLTNEQVSTLLGVRITRCGATHYILKDFASKNRVKFNDNTKIYSLK